MHEGLITELGKKERDFGDQKGDSIAKVCDSTGMGGGRHD